MAQLKIGSYSFLTKQLNIVKPRHALSAILSKSLTLLMFIVSYASSAYTETPKVEFYESDNVTNQIPYFDNRFRIDAMLEEITLLFYRKAGSPPIVLVRPDGSKLKINNLPKEQVEWFDDRTFDMIKIKKPMPGPWQALGDILPQSRIMVVSEIKLAVEPLPEIILSGETLKVTGRLFNGELAIDNPLFRAVVELNVDFFSTNNSAYDNFGAEPVKLTSFRDDGHDLDEYANDNIFTGEFEVDFAPGEWVPIYLIKLPMASRKINQTPIILHEAPIKLSVETGTDEFNKHKVQFTIDPTYVDPDSIILQGKLTYPDKQELPFSVMEGRGKKRIEEFEYTEPGIHRVKVSAFGHTVNGREFRLVLPEFTFNVEFTEINSPRKVVGGDSAVVSEINDAEFLANKEAAAKKLETELLAQAMAEKEAQQERILMIVLANIIIISAAFIAFFIVRRKKKNN